jgi:hypothetical protein
MRYPARFGLDYRPQLGTLTRTTWIRTEFVSSTCARPGIPLPLAATSDGGFARQSNPRPRHLSGVNAALSNPGVFCASGGHTASAGDIIRIKSGRMGTGVEVSWPRPTVAGDVPHIEGEVAAA